MGDNFDIVNPTSDYGFQKVTENSDIVSGFLNCVLNLNPPITSVQVINSELNSSFLNEGDFTVDLLCNTTDGQLILVEMQNNWSDMYATKAIVELCRLVSSFDEKMPNILGKRKNRSGSSVKDKDDDIVKRTEVNSGLVGPTAQLWKRIKRVITCVITNKPTSNAGLGDIVNEFEFIKHNHTSQTSLFKIECRIVIICLANFQKKEHMLESCLDKWLYAFKDATQVQTRLLYPFKHITSLSKVVGEGLDQVPALMDFYAALRLTNIPPNVVREYQNSLDWYNLAMASNEQEVMIATKVEFIFNLHGNGVDVKVIAQTFRLPEEVIVRALADRKTANDVVAAALAEQEEQDEQAECVCVVVIK